MVSYQFWRDLSQHTSHGEIMQTLHVCLCPYIVEIFLFRFLNKWWFFAEFFWRCILRKQVEKGLAVVLGIMSVAILLAEATLLPSVDLSLFSILIKSVGTQEMLVQVDQFI